MSRLFACILAAFVITVVGYFGIWEWPAWPAFGMLYLLFGAGDPWLELSMTARAATLVGLIAFNVAVWTAVVWMLARFIRPVRGPRTQD
jgi:hypothetical protein